MGFIVLWEIEFHEGQYNYIKTSFAVPENQGNQRLIKQRVSRVKPTPSLRSELGYVGRAYYEVKTTFKTLFVFILSKLKMYKIKTCIKSSHI